MDRLCSSTSPCDAVAAYRPWWLLRLAVFCWVLTVPLSAHAETAKVYTVGVVPQYAAAEIHRIWRPLLDELERRTGLAFQLTGSASIPAFESEFEAGRFDFAYMNPYHIGGAARLQGYLPLVRDVGEMLQGIVVVRKDSPIRNMTDLEGRSVAFPSPNALGASMLVRADLQDVYKVKVRPRYVQSHSSVYLNVALGQADAGGGVQKTLDHQSPKVREALRVIHRTREFPPHPIAGHPRVPQADIEKVKTALLQMGKDPAGQALLARIPIRRIGPAAVADYQSLQELGLERFFVEE